MEIYVVQQGDTLDLIALKFGISIEKLILDNGIKKGSNLVIGQTLVIASPIQVYTVKEGDTLDGIAEAFHVTVMQLLRNNPDLANRQFIYPGEDLIISYENNNGKLLTAGYTYPFINDRTLKMTLPYLTYLPIFHYQLTSYGEFIGSDEDIDVIRTAKIYGTIPTLVVTAFSQVGEINLETAREVLHNPETQDKTVENLLHIVKAKGYSGVNLAFQFINATNQQLYLNFLTNVYKKLHPEGYSIFLTINTGLSYNGNEITFEKINYSDFEKFSDGILFLSYDWGTIDRPPVQMSIITTDSLLEYITAQVPLEKIRIGLPTLGYDWQLPYVAGFTKANALNFDSVLSLASQMNAVINYDETNLTAHFEYVDNNDNPHIVWFKDARSIDSSIKILKSYGIYGIGIWTIMYYFNQMWMVINTQYEIEKIETNNITV